MQVNCKHNMMKSKTYQTNCVTLPIYYKWNL